QERRRGAMCPYESRKTILPRFVLTECEDENARGGEDAAGSGAMRADRKLRFLASREVTDGRLTERIEPAVRRALDQHRNVVRRRVPHDLPQARGREDAAPVRGGGEDVGFDGQIVEAVAAHVLRELVGEARPDRGDGRLL